MRQGLAFDDIFAVMSAASVGDTTARVPLPAEPDMDDAATKLGVALNILLDDLALRTNDLRETGEQLRQAQKMEAIGRLAGGVAHDFNNLLTAVVGFGSLLAESLPDGEERWMAGQIVDAGKRGAALTHQLLALGRRQILAPRILDPGEVVIGLTPLIERIIGEHIEFKTIEAPDPVHVRADPSQLEQVLVNLIANARDAMPSGGRLTVELASVELDALYAATRPEVVPGPYVMIAISDTGSGMTDEVREHIFEPFYTTKQGSGGTGLGLATVYGIVKQSGGSIGVYSEPGQGTAFKVYLPRAFEAPEERAAPTDEPLVSAGGETILLAEDDEAVRGIAVLALSRAGYQVLVADNGRMALQLAADHAAAIHLLITDVVMREMSGRELAEELGPLRPEMRILYMSGYTENTVVHHGVLDPGIEFLAKPFTPTALVRKVRELLGQGAEEPARR